MSEEIDAATVDFVRVRRVLDQLVQKAGPIVPHAPFARVQCRGTREGKSLGGSEAFPGIDERTTVAAGSMKQHHQRHRGGPARFRAKERVFARAAAEDHLSRGDTIGPSAFNGGIHGKSHAE